jgi:hypothetical protein
MNEPSAEVVSGKSGERVETAETLLREAVYRSRASQAELTTPAPDGKGACGLGAKAAVDLDLTPKARLCLSELWPAPASAPELERIRAALAAWVRAQDALDRKRNHFLKAFRQAHGFDRRAYAPNELAAFEQGLEAINAEESRALRAAAIDLLG